MRLPFRSIGTLCMAVGVATCADVPSSLIKHQPGGQPAAGRLAFQPVFSKEARAVFAQSDGYDIHFDSVHVVIRGFPDTTAIVKDTTVFFSDTSTAPLVLDLSVPVATDFQRFDAGLGYEQGHDVQYFGSAVVQSHPADQPGQPQTITINYSGPGATVAAIQVAPTSASIRADASGSFTVSAVDSSGKSTQPPPILWSVSDNALATVGANGTTTVVHGLGRAGTVTLTATSPTGLAASAAVTLTLPPSGIELVSGGGQSGLVTTQLPNPAVVRVTASDGSGVAGISVIFAAPTGGGVGAASVVTDASGAASTTLKLGTTAGTEGFAATANGFTVGITETATPTNPAAVAAASGGGQTGTVGQPLAAPLVAQVSDAFGNAVSGATVSWSTSGSGKLSAASSASSANGTASVAYTLGALPASDTITAAVNGATTAARFVVIGKAGAPASIVAVSGDAQKGTAGQPLAAPLVVKVTDAGGNAVPGATISWTTTAGSLQSATTTADAQGVVQNTLTLGTRAGNATVAASVDQTHTVTFTATAQPGAVAALSFARQPANTATDGLLGPVEVHLLDAFGNLTTSTATITMTLGANTSGGSLVGTSTRAAVAGAAIFGDLTVSKPGAGYTLVATSGAVSATSDPFDIALGAPAILSLVGPATLTFVAGAAPAFPKAFVSDLAGNGVPGVHVRTVVTKLPETVVVDTTFSSDAAGMVDLGLLAARAVHTGTYAITASATGLRGSPVTLSGTVTPAAAKQVVYLVAPDSGVAGQHIVPAPQLAVVDTFGNVVTSATAAIHVAIKSGTGTAGAVLSGDTVLAAAGGLATFSNLSIDRAGTGYCLLASSPGLASSCSPPFRVTAGVPAKLVIQQQPVGGAAGTSIGVVKVAVADANGAIISTASTAITLTLSTNPDGGALSGTATQNAANGVAAFGGLSIDKAAVGYAITASAPGLTSATTGAFNVTAAAPARLAFATQPSTVAAGVSIAPPVVVQVQDAFGNVVGAAANAVTLGIATGPGTQISGNGPITAQNGNATFSGVQVATAGAYTLQATAAGLTPATSAPFTVSVGAPATMALAGPSTMTVTAGTTPTLPSVLVKDAAGNSVTGVPLHVVVVAQPSTTVTDTTVHTDAAGAFDLTLIEGGGGNKHAGVFVVTVSGGGLQGSPITFTGTVVPAAPAALAFVAGPGPTVAGTSLSPAPQVAVVDAYGNTVTSSAAAVTVAIKPGSGASGATLSGTKTVDAAAGVATLGGLSIDRAAVGYLLTASAGTLAPATSAPFTVLSSTATQLVITQQPTGGSATGTIGNVKVAHEDALGNVVANDTESVTLALTTPVTGVSLNGTLTQHPVGGVASFNNLAIGKAGAGYVVTASAKSESNASTISFNVTPGVAARLSFVAPPAQSVAAGADMTIQVEALDAQGNRDTAYAGVDTLAIADGPAGAQILGGTTSGAVHGLATFAGVQLSMAGGYALRAKSGTLSPANSGAITVSAGSPATLQFSVPDASVTAGMTFPAGPTVTLTDANRNLIAGDAVTFAVTQAGQPISTLLPQTLTTDATGTIALQGIQPGALPKTAGTYNLVASIGGVSASMVLNVGPAAAAKLVIAQQPSASVSSGDALATQPVVQVQDGFGNDATISTPIAVVSSAGTLGGTTSVIPTGGGVAAFTNLSITAPSGTATLTFSGSGVGSVISNSVAISAGRVAKLYLSAPGPLIDTAGVPPKSAPALLTLDASNNPVAGIPVKVVVDSGTSHVFLRDTTIKSDASGAIAYSGVPLVHVGAYRLIATSDSVPNAADTLVIGVLPGPAAAMMFVVPRTITQYPAVAGTAITTIPVAVALVDAFGNPAVTSADSIHLTLAGSGTPVGVTGARTSGGIAVFPDFSIDTVGDYTMVAHSVAGLPNATSIPVHVVAGLPTQLGMTGAPSGTLTLNAALATITDTLKDAFGNVATNAVGSVTMTLSGGAALNGTTMASVVAGVATFSGLSVGSAGTGLQLTATYSGNASATATSGAFGVSLPPIAGLSLSIGRGHAAPSSIADDALLTNQGAAGPKVQLVDANGSPVAQAGILVTAAVTAAVPTAARRFGGPSVLETVPAPPALSVTSARTDENGVADFTGAKLNGTAGRFLIQFSATPVSDGPTYTVSTGTLQLTHGAAHAIAGLTSLPSVVTPGHKLSARPRFRVTDVDGNLVDGASLHFAFTGGTGDVLGTASSADTTTDGNGEGGTDYWSVGDAGAHTLEVSVPGLSGVVLDLSVKSAAVAKLALSQTNLGVLHNGDAIPAIGTAVIDADGDTLQDTTFTLSVRGVSHSDHVVSIQGNAATDSHGKASVSGLVVDAETQSGAALDFSVDGEDISPAEVTFDVIAGPASEIDVVGVSSLAGFSGEGAPIPTVMVKDHHGRNGVPQGNVQVTWTLGAGCPLVLSNGASTATSATDATTGETSVLVTPSSNFTTGSCTLTASTSSVGGGSSVTFTLVP